MIYISFCGITRRDRATTTDYAKHSMDFTLIITFFSIIFRGTSMWHSAWDSVCLGWQSSENSRQRPSVVVPETLQVTWVRWRAARRRFAQIGTSIYLTVFCVYALGGTFIVRDKLTVERGIHFHTIVFFSHSLEYYIARVFQKLLRLDVVRIDYRINQNDFRTRRFLARREIFSHHSRTHYQRARIVAPIAILHPRVARPRIVYIQ